MIPGDAENNHDLGFALYLVRDYTAAVPRLETAVRLRPDWGQAHHNLAMTLWNLRQYGPALTHARSAQLLGVAGAGAVVRALTANLRPWVSNINHQDAKTRRNSKNVLGLAFLGVFESLWLGGLVVGSGSASITQPYGRKDAAARNRLCSSCASASASRCLAESSGNRIVAHVPRQLEALGCVRDSLTRLAQICAGPTRQKNRSNPPPP